MPDSSDSPQDFVINGRFLSQRLSGVQRYAREIVAALDRLIVADPEGLGRHRWRVVTPPDASARLDLRAIEQVGVGRHRGHLWEQWDLLRAARGAKLVNLGNSGPVLHPRSYVVMHDVAVFRTPANFSPRYARAHRMLGRLLARRARLGTVSLFSRGEIEAALGVPAKTIFVARNGCDHIGRVAVEADAPARLGLGDAPYFLFVGSPTRNKNLAVALAAFARLSRPDARFVVAGSLNKGVFDSGLDEDMPGLVLAPGLSDGALRALFQGATALVFPSRYEGFGIPPLEAMAEGCPVIASDIPVVREVCGDAAVYFHPDDMDGLAAIMRTALEDPSWPAARAEAARRRTGLFTWESAARDLAAAITAR